MACALGGLQSAPQSPAPAETTSPLPQPSLPGLDVSQVMNMQVQLAALDSHPIVELTNGEYHAGSAANSTDYADVTLVADHIALGDLNGDGLGDAAALLAENYGGSGVFVSVIAVLNSGGQPVQAGAALIDDRPKVTGLEIKNRRVVFTGAIHGSTDPGCCASMSVVETFGLTKGDLQMQRLTSGEAGGPERSISIGSPPDGSQVLPAIVQVSGTVSPALPESTLPFRAYDATGKEWVRGSFPVSAGTFGGQIDLTQVPAGLLLRLEVSDINSADGSTMAMDSIELLVK